MTCLVEMFLTLELVVFVWKLSVTEPRVANKTSVLEIVGLKNISEYSKAFFAAVKRLNMIAASICKDCSSFSRKPSVLFSLW